ncbi:MAG: UPF0182 family protein, partial [Acidimicrobiia bacterium]
AFDGTIRLYVMDADDPVLASYRRIFPAIFIDGDQMPEELRQHLRYPVDLFRIQSEVWRNYHMDTAAEFFRAEDAWSIPEDPSTTQRGAVDLLRGDRVAGADITQLDEMLPYYLLMKLPGEEDLSYAFLQPFTPVNRRNMQSFLVADSDAGTYGRIFDFRLPRTLVVDGPGQVEDRINQNDLISEQFTLWDQQGSNVLRGDMLIVPIEESLLYVQPVYLEAADGGLPEFRRAIVVFGDQVVMRGTLGEALGEVFEADFGTFGGRVDGDEDDGVALPGTARELLDEAAEAFAAAEAALASGDLGEFQRQIDEARRLVEEARAILEQATEAALGRRAS